jgi:hypothetical protein
VVQPVDLMELASGLIACAVPLARARWPWAAAWPGAARAAGANPTAAAAAPVKTVATRIAFREVVVLVAAFMNWPLPGMPLPAASALALPRNMTRARHLKAALPWRIRPGRLTRGLTGGLTGSLHVRWCPGRADGSLKECVRIAFTPFLRAPRQGDGNQNGAGTQLDILGGPWDLPLIGAGNAGGGDRDRNARPWCSSFPVPAGVPATGPGAGQGDVADRAAAGGRGCR